MGLQGGAAKRRSWEASGDDDGLWEDDVVLAEAQGWARELGLQEEAAWAEEGAGVEEEHAEAAGEEGAGASGGGGPPRGGACDEEEDPFFDRAQDEFVADDDAGDVFGAPPEMDWGDDEEVDGEGGEAGATAPSAAGKGESGPGGKTEGLGRFADVCDALVASLERLFRDATDSGHYSGDYATKHNPTVGGTLPQWAAGVERLNQEMERDGGAEDAEEREVEMGRKMLIRLETSGNRATLNKSQR